MNIPKSNIQLLPRSLTSQSGVEYALAQVGDGPRLVVSAPADSAVLQTFEGERSESGKQTLLLCPLSPANAESLRWQ